MRATVIGLIALPVAAGGLAATVILTGSGDPDAPSVSSDRTATAGAVGEAPAGTSPAAEHDGGTAIDGAKPHLTVIDGMSILPVPAPIPSILSQLPVPRADLAPLPPASDERTEPASAGADARIGRGGIPGALRTPDVLASAGPRADRDDPPADADPGAATGTGVSPAAVGGQEEPPSDSGQPPLMSPRPAAEATAPGGHPPHANVTGRPPHADETGRPPHADDTGRPPQASGRGPEARTAGTPAAGSPGDESRSAGGSDPEGPARDNPSQR